MPDYREAVFQALQNNTSIKSEFVAGTHRPGFETVPLTKSIDLIHVKNRWLGKFLWQSGLLGLLKREKYDVVVFRGSWWTLSTWVGVIMARLQGSTVLFWLIAWRRPEKGLKGMFRPLYLRLVHGLLLYGERAKVLGVQHGYPDARMKVIGNSLPLPTTPIDIIAAPSGKPTVLWVARLNAEKRADMLLDAIALAHQRGHAIHCVIVGRGDDTALKAQASELGINDSVEFLGGVEDGPQMTKLFDDAYVVATPASAGLTVANGLVNGVPVVANSNPNLNSPEWAYLHPEPQSELGLSRPNGSYFNQGNVEEFCDELIRWCIREPATTEHRQEIARVARLEASPVRSSDAIVEAISYFLSRTVNKAKG